MIDIDQLSAISDLEAAQLVSEDAFAELADQIVASPLRAGSGGRQRRRPIGLPVAAAVTAAALVVAGVLVARDRAARTDANPAPSTSPSQAARPASTAAQLVAYATRSAAAQTFAPRPRQWLYTDVLTAISTRHGRGTTFERPFRAVSTQTWERLDGARSATLLPDGKLDRNVVGGPFTRGVRLFGWPNVSYRYLESLPSSPARLTAIIKSNLRADKNGPMRMNPVDGGTAVFQAVATLLGDIVVLPPRLQAGLYGVLAHDPAVRFHPSVTDYARRTGAAFSASLDHGDTETLIVVNTRTFAYMGSEQISRRTFTQTENDGTYHFHKGQVLSLEAVLAAGIVNHPGQRP